MQSQVLFESIKQRQRKILTYTCLYEKLLELPRSNWGFNLQASCEQAPGIRSLFITTLYNRSRFHPKKKWQKWKSLPTSLACVDIILKLSAFTIISSTAISLSDFRAVQDAVLPQT